MGFFEAVLYIVGGALFAWLVTETYIGQQIFDFCFVPKEHQARYKDPKDIV